MLEYETFEYDVLVIGAGGAGLRAAIEASAVGVVKSVLGWFCRPLRAAVCYGNLDRLANPVTFRNERERTSAPNRIAPEAGKALAVGEAESTHTGGYSRIIASKHC